MAKHDPKNPAVSSLLYMNNRETDEFGRTDQNVKDAAITILRNMPGYFREIVKYYTQVILSRTLENVNNGILRTFRISDKHSVIAPAITLESLNELSAAEYNGYRTIYTSDEPKLTAIILAICRLHFKERGIEVEVEMVDRLPLFGISGFLVHIINTSMNYKYRPCLVKNEPVLVKGDLGSLFATEPLKDLWSSLLVGSPKELPTTRPPLVIATTATTSTQSKAPPPPPVVSAIKAILPPISPHPTITEVEQEEKKEKEKEKEEIKN